MSGFIHLRVHSAYSLAEGAITIKDLLGLSKAFDMPAVAVTDTGNLFGVLEFSMAASKEGVQPILGFQAWVERPEAKDPARKNTLEDPDQLVLLAQNEEGYKNLLKLTSNSWIQGQQGGKPIVSWEDLAQFSSGVICLSGGPKGSVGRLLGEGQAKEAENILLRLKEIFGDRLYIELMRHGTAEEVAIEDGLLDLAYAHDVPIVATNDCFFPDREMYLAHDALLCISQGATVQQEDRRRVTPEHYFKSGAQMQELFSDLPEAIENTHVIAQRCSFLLKGINPILPRFESESGKSETEEMIDQARAGLDWRLEKYVFTPDMDEAKRQELRKEYFDRLDYEIDILVKMGFAGYFLIVADFIQWAKDNGIPVGPGRGSGAGSVVAWAMRITDLDPIAMKLLFERFLNPERVSMPDFDIDFCQERRDEVIAYVRNRYGHDRVAQIITFGKLQARAVVRDVGRVLQIPYGYVDKIAKMIPQNPANPVSLAQALDSEALLRDARDSDENIKRLLDIALQLEGLYRHASTHAAGVVIGDRPLVELVPLYLDPGSEVPATQFNMKYVEPAGLVKFDFLGLKTLDVIKDSIDLVKQTSNVDIDPLDLPMDDEKTFAMLAKGDCMGVFQLESAGMRDLCKQMGISNFEQIGALVALYRPGPMENIPRYLACMHGKEEIDYMHPLLKPVLEDTYGIMIYQEQVMQAAQVLSGYTLGGADLLRRAMGKKIKSEMDAQRETFVKGAVANNIPAEQASMIFDQMEKFAGYGFNRAHSAAYAFIAYQTAYLKANYPVEFMAATMTHDRGNTEKLAMLRQEAQKMGITLLPPDINKSHPRFSVEFLPDGSKAVRYALAALKGVGEAAMKAVVAEREANGAFKSLYDFARRIDPRMINKRQMESLAAAGAFDAFVPDRSVMLAAVEGVLKYASAVAEERNSGQVSLFGEAGGSGIREPELPKAEKWDLLEKLKHEFDAVGFYLSAHPLDDMATQLERLRVVPSTGITDWLRTSTTTRLKLAGIVVRKMERVSQKGNKFAFVQVSDTHGIYEVTLFSETLAAARPLLDAGTAVLLTVDADRKSDEEIRLICQRVEPLADAASAATARLEIKVETTEAIPQIKQILFSQGRGRVKVCLLATIDGGRQVEIELPDSWNIAAEASRALRTLPGVAAVREL